MSERRKESKKKNIKLNLLKTAKESITGKEENKVLLENVNKYINI